MSDGYERITVELRRLDDELAAAVTLPAVDTVIRRAGTLNRASTAAAAAVLTVGALGATTAVAQLNVPAPAVEAAAVTVSPGAARSGPPASLPVAEQLPGSVEGAPAPPAASDPDTGQVEVPPPAGDPAVPPPPPAAVPPAVPPPTLDPPQRSTTVPPNNEGEEDETTRPKPKPTEPPKPPKPTEPTDPPKPTDPPTTDPPKPTDPTDPPSDPPSDPPDDPPEE